MSFTTTAPRPSTPPSAAPATPARPPTPAATKVRRRPAMIGLGIALVALSVFAVIFLTNALGKTVQVAAVTERVQRGDVIEASDLSVVDLPGGPTSLQTVPASDINAIVGQRANVDLLPGSLLTPASYVETLTPEAGTSIVGIALTSLQMPLELLNTGDSVRIVSTPTNQGEAPVEDPQTLEATVLSFKASATGDQTIINVEVPQEDAAALAARAATGRVALILDSPGE